MRYLLDTNTCIHYLNVRNSSVARKLQTLQPRDVTVCPVVKAELFFGAMRSANPARTLMVQQRFLNRFVSLPFDDPAAEVYGRVRADLAARGTPIGPNDLLIAAIALANNVTLVTNNTREFSRVAGLHLEDWQTTP